LQGLDVSGSSLRFDRNASVADQHQGIPSPTIAWEPDRHLKPPRHRRSRALSQPIQQYPMCRIADRQPGRVRPRAQLEPDDREKASNVGDRQSWDLCPFDATDLRSRDPDRPGDLGLAQTMIHSGMSEFQAEVGCDLPRPSASCVSRPLFDNHASMLPTADQHALNSDSTHG
jgi:hypothetical protein